MSPHETSDSLTLKTATTDIAEKSENIRFRKRLNPERRTSALFFCDFEVLLFPLPFSLQ
jgi:hypothetical protein